MTKAEVIYGDLDPTESNVTYVAIQTGILPPYVWRTYCKGEPIPQFPDDVAVLPKKAADNLFQFKKGSISDLCK